jgi:hypothetical protein|tara:strand:- start:57 stop:272 length:216 start_codon:yes stop_codon:yes gene_type:complete
MKKDKKFAFVFWCGYQINEGNKPKIDYVNEKAISIDNGFDEQDVKDIKEMSVGCKTTISGVFEEMSVYRYQ